MTTTTQTPRGAVTTITMVRADGAAPPSQINLPDGTTITPNADGSLSVSAEWAGVLGRAGWFVKMTPATLPV